jgi:hypothetical protein
MTRQDLPVRSHDGVQDQPRPRAYRLRGAVSLRMCGFLREKEGHEDSLATGREAHGFGGMREDGEQIDMSAEIADVEKKSSMSL